MARRVIWITAVACALLARSSAALLGAQLRHYDIEDLGTLGGSITIARGINDAGVTVGYANTVEEQVRAVRFLPGSDPEDLGTLGGPSAQAHAINAAGQIAGFSETASREQHAFRRSDAGAMEDLGTLGGALSLGFGANAIGEVAGYSSTSSNLFHAFRYAGGAMQDLGTLGGAFSFAFGINDAGDVAGHSYTLGNAAVHAFRYAGGAMQDLGTLGGATAPTSYGLAINANGDVVGWSRTTGNKWHAYRYRDAAGMEDLGTLGGNNSGAEAVNGAGDVVGWAQIADSTQRAFLFTDAGGMIDLNDTIDPSLGWVLTLAGGINDAGQVIGQGTLNGQRRAFRLTPSLADDTPPVIVASLSAMPNAAGWHNEPVTVTWSVTDPESDISASSGCDTVTVGETAGTTVTCSATNGAGLEASESVTFKIDLTPPTVSCAADPSTLWPPNHRLVAVQVSFEIEQDLSGAGAFVLSSMGSSEPDDGSGDGDTPVDMLGFAAGDAANRGWLRAERSGPGTGRVYTLTYSVADGAGNPATCQARVTVPHDRRK